MEFWQLLVGTISGFIIAFLAEPVKTFFENRNKKNRLRKSLYREICYLYEALFAYFLVKGRMRFTKAR